MPSEGTQMRLPFKLRRIRRVRGRCWYCERVFTRVVRALTKPDENGEQEWADARTGKRLTVAVNWYCPNCGPGRDKGAS